MGIKSFIFILFFISIGFLTVTTIFTNPTIKKTKDLPAITFINSTMYEINTQEVTQIIKSKKAFHFTKYDELYDATIIMKSKEKEKTITNTVNANLIKLTDSLIKFRGNVRYDKTSNISLYSEALDYDRLNQHLIGNQKFVAYQDGNKLTGNSLSIKKGKVVFKTSNNKPVKLDITMSKKEKNETN